MVIQISNWDVDKTDESFMDIIILGTCALVSILLMIFFFVTFCVKKKFDHSFYRFVQMDFATNVLCSINAWLAIRMRNKKFFIPMLTFIASHAESLLDATDVISFFFFHLQVYTACSIIVHRILSIYPTHAMAIRYSKFKPWSPLQLFHFGLMIVVSAVCVYLKRPSTMTHVFVLNGTIYSTTELNEMYLFQYTISTFSAGYCLIFACLTITVFLILTEQIGEAKMFKPKKAARKLAVLAIITCVTHGTILCWGCISAYNSYKRFYKFDSANTSSWFLAFFSDIVTLSPPFVFLYSDENVSTYMKLFRGRRGRNRVASISSSIPVVV